MPSIASRLYNPASGAPPPTWPSSTSPGKPVATPEAPGMSPVLRCPLPILTTPSPDNLRQYYAGGSIPQYRINTPLPITGTAISSTSTSSSGTLSGSLTTTAKTQDIVAVAGAALNSFVSVSPTNSTAAAMTGVYAAIVTAGQVVVHHPATAGGTFNILVQTNN